MKIVHKDNGYSVSVDYRDGKYHIWFNSLSRKGMPNRLTLNGMFPYSCKSEEKLKKVLRNYIEMTSLFGNARKNGWRPGFKKNNEGIVFSIIADAKEKDIIDHSINLLKPLSTRQWKKMEKIFPTGTPEDYQTNGNTKIQSVVLEAGKIRKEIFENQIFSNPDVDVESAVNYLETLENPDIDVQEALV